MIVNLLGAFKFLVTLSALKQMRDRDKISFVNTEVRPIILLSF